MPDMTDGRMDHHPNSGKCSQVWVGLGFAFRVRVSDDDDDDVL